MLFAVFVLTITKRLINTYITEKSQSLSTSEVPEEGTMIKYKVIFNSKRIVSRITINYTRANDSNTNKEYYTIHRQTMILLLLYFNTCFVMEYFLSLY